MALKCSSNSSDSTTSSDRSTSYSAEQFLPLLEALQSARDGDFSRRLPVSRGRPNNGVSERIYATDNDVIGLNGSMADEIEGTPVKREFLRIGTTVSTMVDQLSSFTGKVTRVAREVGTEGKLGVQAEVKGVSGTWKDLTDRVNFMASNLMTQMRGIAKVVTAVADGDLKQKLRVEAKGEVAALADTINGMTDTLSIFADQVTTVASGSKVPKARAAPSLSP